jgi:hypothetical protein
VSHNDRRDERRQSQTPSALGQCRFGLACSIAILPPGGAKPTTAQAGIVSGPPGGTRPAAWQRSRSNYGPVSVGGGNAKN